MPWATASKCGASVGGKMLGKSVRQLDLRKVYGINIIAVEHGNQTNVEFAADYTFKEGDRWR